MLILCYFMKKIIKLIKYNFFLIYAYFMLIYVKIMDKN